MILNQSSINIITLLILVQGALCEYDLSACDEIFPCQNNGTCTVEPTSSNGTFMCICPPGFSGPQCDLDISVCNTTENACLNGGKCTDGIGANFFCQCEPGWTGSVCEIDVDECESQPCQSGGLCVDKVDDYSCACPFGYTGKACESKLRICEINPCKNDAFCLHEEEDETKLTCYCVPDFHGTLCEFRYDDCDPEPKCFNGGSCIDGVGEFFCSCPVGFFGKTCQCTLENITSPECQYNETHFPSISEIPLYPSVSITEPVIITTRILPISATPFMSTSIISETFKPEATVSFDPAPSQPISSNAGSSEGRITTEVIESPWYLSTAGMATDSIKPTDLISGIQSLSLLPESPSISTPSSEKSFEVEITPTQSETIYDPCPSISLDGTEGLLMPSSMSLFSTPFPNRTDGELTTPMISEEPLLSPSPSILISEEIAKTGIPSIAMEESSGIFMTVPFASPSVPIEVTPTIVAPPENDIISGISSMPPLLSTADISFETPMASESHVDSIPSPSMPPLSASSKVIESIESLEFSPEFSTVDIVQSLSPSISEFAVTHMLSPTTSTFPMLSPSEIILPPSIIILESESAVVVTPVLKSDLVTTVISLQSEELINASRRSDDNVIPPFITSTLAVMDSSTAIYGTASLPIEVIITTAITTTGPSTSIHESDVSLSPTPSMPLTTPEPTITVPTPPVGNLSDPCINYCQNNAKCNSTSIQPVCICPFKFIGDRCEIPRKRFSSSSFTGDSFLGYKVPNESINRINVVTRLATSAPEGILFYTAVGRVYVLIFTQGGHVTLHFSCGAQSMHFVETRTRVDNGFNFTLQFKMEMIVQGVSELHCIGQVSVNESYIMRGEQIVGHNGVNENPTQLIYLGGVGAPNAYKNDDLIGILPGFRGCLYKLTINQEEKDLFEDAVDGKEVSECSTFGCIANPCLGISKCVTSTIFPFWQCICSPGFQGVKCQIRVCDSTLNPCLNGATCTFSSEESSNSNYTDGERSLEVPRPICLCPLGISGSVCQSKVNITKPSFKPLSGFDYSAFIAYEPIPRFVEWVQFKLHFVPANNSQIALLLYSGYIQGLYASIPSSEQLEDTLTDLVKEDSPQGRADLNTDFATAQRISDFFAITYVHGYITLTWNLGSGTQRIITPSRIDRRLNIHTLFAGRSGRQAWLKVDGMRNVTGKSPGPFHRLNVNSELFVGGYESFRFEGLPHDLPLHKGFEGCIFDFGFRVKNRLYLPRPLRGRNVKNCYEEDC